MQNLSPVAAIPVLDPRVSQLQDRAGSLLNSAWASLSRPKQRSALAAQMQAMGQTPGQTPGQAQGLDFQANAYPDIQGLGDNVPRSLIASESGGNWAAQNNETGHGGKPGHFGFLQFGQARLEDAKRAGVVPADMTPEQFLKSEKTQIAAANWHFDDIDARIRQRGYDRFVGQTVGGVPLTMDGMRAMAHLGGFGGLAKFIETGGAYNPADSFGTSLKKYGQMHGL